MDYVLFGMGYGASLMLVGWALRTFGPQLKYSQPQQADDADFQVAQRFWIRFIQGLGGVVAIAGTTMVLMTFVVVLVNPDDDTGGIIALAIWAFVLIAVVLWCWMYVRHYGTTGIWSREDGYGFRRSPMTTPLRQSGDTRATRTSFPGKRRTPEELPTPLKPEEYGPDTVPAEAELVEDPVDEPVDEPAPQHDEVLSPATEEPAPETGDSPVYDFGDGDDTTVPSGAIGRAEALRRLRERQARNR